MSCCRKTLLTVVASVACAGPAFAQATASGSITNFTYELIDLTPDDGIAPSVSFDLSAWQSGVALALTDTQAGVDNRPQVRGASALGPISSSASYVNPDLSPATELSASGSLSGNLQSGVSMHGAASTFATQGSGYAFVQAFVGTIPFVLSPGSAVSFSADLWASAAYGATSMPGQYLYAGAEALVQLWENTGDGGENFDILEVVHHSPNSTNGDFTSKHMTAVVRNTGGTATDNMVWFSVIANTHSVAPSTSPIPEPATYAMLMAGVGVVALARRRRR